MAHFILRTPLPATAEEVFAWHERPGALERLLPPWQDVRLERSQGGLEVGARRVLSLGVGPLRVPLHAVHTACEPGRSFQDTMQKGPFRHWKHHHRFLPRDDQGSVLEDEVEMGYHGGRLVEKLAHPFVHPSLRRMFTFRHRRTRQDLERHAGKPTLRVAVTGASGFVGRGLSAFLTTGGHTVVRLERRRPLSPGAVYWDPSRQEVDAAGLEGLDAVIHLAGENLAGHRWTPAFKQKIVQSRREATAFLAQTLAGLKTPPKTLLSGSAIGWYGSSEAPVTEESGSGRGFLAEVCREWEDATRAAEEAGIRVVHMRIGVVLGAQGGALASMLPAFRMGLGGTLGSGRQGTSWISREDTIGAMHALLYSDLAGPVNLVSPNPVTNEELTRTLARVLGRPAFMRLEPWLLKMAFGEMAEEALLASQWVLPARLQQAQFPFLYPDLEGALRAELGRFTLTPEASHAART